MKHFQIDDFIKNHVTGRTTSLLAEDMHTYHKALRTQIDGHSVLVIGGAGTIGSAFVKEVLRFSPARLYIVDISENGLTELTRDIRSSVGLNIPQDYKTYPISYTSPVFRKLFLREGPFDVIANFAAHKHVRSEKDPYSIEAMIENNVLQAKKLMDLLCNAPPQHFFCVSTDKASNPVNVMGASKKLMEEMIMAYSEKLTVTTARFANVAFSNGSLLYGYLERMVKRQPLVAPLNIYRYFVSPREAGQICLLACLLGESGDIFFPKLHAEDMKTFASIVPDFLREYGNWQPLECISEDEAREKAASLSDEENAYPVYYFQSTTSGEKLFEEFFTENELVDQDRFVALGVIKNAIQRSIPEIETIITSLQNLFESNTPAKNEIIDTLHSLIPNFQHIEKKKSLDQNM